ncbi:hypothetical protein ACQE3E_23465 (plasmid) [Methylomonas sp. MED-D]|uniref:hypothetical protein n=1 Tax=unclassified Methylomonas TaxID=2608980 RepID=UPI00247B0C9D|nr:hypothetical protein [Methylomonas sp. UP202]WGS88616.1 hypothetical protein QC632_25055 [Methylomonas sp. UP202]
MMPVLEQFSLKRTRCSLANWLQAHGIDCNQASLKKSFEFYGMTFALLATLGLAFVSVEGSLILMVAIIVNAPYWLVKGYQRFKRR